MIIRSKLENDVYKWNMSYLYMTKFPNMRVRFKFKNRNGGEKVDVRFLSEMQKELESLRFLSLSDEEKAWMKKQFWWIPGWYFDWYQHADIFNPGYVKIGKDINDEFFCYVEGPGYEVTFWETNILPIYSELRNRAFGYPSLPPVKALDEVKDQISLSNSEGLLFSEFGLRRRYSAEWQDKVDEYIAKNAKYCVGNSNAYEAYKNNQKISGTQAHEIYMAYNAIYGYRQGSYMCVKDWMETFNGHAGILLGDTVGLKTFLSCMTSLYFRASSGFRHDSGDWYKASMLYINKLLDLKINPLHKSIIYSNSIDMYDLRKYTKEMKGEIGGTPGGIGGALTNRIPYIPNSNPNIVMKLDSIQIDEKHPWINCVKVPDDVGKAMGDLKEIEYCKYVTRGDNEEGNSR